MVHAILNPRAAPPRAAGRLALLSVLAVIGAWAERRRQRRALAELPPHLLRDVGIAPGDAWAEARKPFWRG